MGVYSSFEVYPDWFDCINLEECENCTFDCDIHGFCINDCAE
ncbi:hypothetical protein [uncultured Methanobrevibacter sp.]|nr:hypothetical protein [uncultured Methanobrevibacter sp.]